MTMTVEQLFALLRLVPTVEELMFYARTAFHLAFLKGLTDGTPVPGSDQSGHPCPNLRKLVFRGKYWGQTLIVNDTQEEDLGLAVAALVHEGLLRELHTENEQIVHVAPGELDDLRRILSPGLSLQCYLPGECPIRSVCGCEDVKKAFAMDFSAP